jgi:hypothetical protein
MAAPDRRPRSDRHFFATVLRALVHLRYLQVERDGVLILAEAEVDQVSRWVAEFDGAVIDEPIGAVIDELALIVHRSESAVLVEDVVMRQPATPYSPTRVPRRRTALSGGGITELGRRHPLGINSASPASFIKRTCSSHFLTLRQVPTRGFSAAVSAVALSPFFFTFSRVLTSWTSTSGQ